MRPPGAKRGAAPFGSAESHELRSWARLRRAGCAPAPCLPQCFPFPLLSLPLPLRPLKPPLLPSPFLPLPRRPKNSPHHKTPGLRPPRRARCAGAKRGAAPFGSAESHELRSWARLRRAGCAPAPCLPPMLSSSAAFAPSPAPCNFPQRSQPKNSPAAFHRLRGSVHLWYFVPALMAQARYSCSHNSTRAS